MLTDLKSFVCPVVVSKLSKKVSIIHIHSHVLSITFEKGYFILLKKKQ